MNAAPELRLPPVVCRPMVPADRSLVLDSWLRTYSHTAEAIRLGPRYWTVQEARIERCLREAHTLCAFLEGDDPDTVLGWACGIAEPEPTLHYVYVKKDPRRRGIATALTLALGLGRSPKTWMTHKPRRSMREVANRHGFVLRELET